MATVFDQTAFGREVAAAHGAHQEAIRAATVRFEAASKQAQDEWTAAVEKARTAYDEVKDDETRGEAWQQRRAALDAAIAESPDWLAEPRAQLAREIAEADRALNESLKAARRKLLNVTA